MLIRPAILSGKLNTIMKLKATICYYNAAKVRPRGSVYAQFAYIMPFFTKLKLLSLF